VTGRVTQIVAQLGQLVHKVCAGLGLGSQGTAQNGDDGKCLFHGLIWSAVVLSVLSVLGVFLGLKFMVARCRFGDGGIVDVALHLVQQGRLLVDQRVLGGRLLNNGSVGPPLVLEARLVSTCWDCCTMLLLYAAEVRALSTKWAL